MLRDSITNVPKLVYPEAKFYRAVKPYPAPLEKAVGVYVYHPNKNTARTICKNINTMLDCMNHALPSTPDDFQLLVFAADRDMVLNPDNSFFKEL